MALSLAPTRKGVSLAALRIGPFRAAEVRVPQHRLRNRDSMPAGALDRYHSQFRLRQLAVDLAVPNNPNTDPMTLTLTLALTLTLVALTLTLILRP